MYEYYSDDESPRSLIGRVIILLSVGLLGVGAWFGYTRLRAGSDEGVLAASTSLPSAGASATSDPTGETSVETTIPTTVTTRETAPTTTATRGTATSTVPRPTITTVAGSTSPPPRPPGPVPSVTSATTSTSDAVATTAPPEGPDEFTVEIVLTPDRATLEGSLPSGDALRDVISVIERLVPESPVEPSVVVDPTSVGRSATLIIRDERGVGFDRGVDDRLSAEQADTFERLAEVLADWPTTTVVVVGHAVTGSEATDREVSAARAQAGYDALVDAGVADDRIVPYGVGAADTVPTSVESGVNRRLDVVLHGLPVG